MTMEFFDPTGGEPEIPKVEMAKRFSSLEGLRGKILDNTKSNSSTMLSMIGEMMAKEYGVTIESVITKKVGSAPAPEAELEEATKDVDFVLVGTGD